MQFSQFKNFLGRTMKPGQDKSAFIFQRLIAMDKNTDGGAVEIGDFSQIQNEFMEPSFPVCIHEQGNIVRIVNIQLTRQINDDGVFFIPAVDIDFSINPKISLCTFSIKNNLSNEWEIFKEPVLVRLFFFRQLAVLVTQGPLMAEEGF